MNFLLSIIGGKFKFEAQDSFLEYFFLKFGDEKNETHFLKKATFTMNELQYSHGETLPNICTAKSLRKQFPPALKSIDCKWDFKDQLSSCCFLLQCHSSQNLSVSLIKNDRPCLVFGLQVKCLVGFELFD